jgi:hypothetical protein
MKLIFNPDPILSSSFDRNRQNNQFILPLLKSDASGALERSGASFNWLGRGREGDVRLWYSCTRGGSNSEIWKYVDVIDLDGDS